ncbi:MAG: site-2 protease family protein, partial [Segetibacter sp.]
MDKEQLKKPAEPWEFRSKKAWQRLIIMIGGVVVNIVLAIALFIMIMYVWGEEYLPAKNLTYGIHADSLATKMGLQDGDKIVSIGGKPVDNIETVEAEIILSEAKQLQVERNGQPITLQIPEGLVKQLNKNKLQGFIDVRFPVIFDSVAQTARFTQGTVEKGDKLISFNNKPIQFFHEFEGEKSKLKNVEVPLKVLRGSDTVDIKAKVNEKSALGIYFKPPGSIFGTTVKTYSLAQAFPVGFNKCFETLERYVTGLKQLFTGKVNASDSLGSVISIGNTFPSLWDWQKFWTLTAIFSIILAFMNILPIPALDGGHALFTLVEMVSGRKPSDKFMEYAQMAGMVLLLGLMAYALGLDFWRLFK